MQNANHSNKVKAVGVPYLHQRQSNVVYIDNNIINQSRGKVKYFRVTSRGNNMEFYLLVALLFYCGLLCIAEYQAWQKRKKLGE